MLYDNAQLVELLTYAWLATGEAVFKARVEETIVWLTREMRLPGGAFAASLDADSEGHEGKFYVWTRAEVIDVLGAEEGAFFADAYDIAEGGNWEGVSIPNPARPRRAIRCRRGAAGAGAGEAAVAAGDAHPPREPTTRSSPTGTDL